MSPRPRMSVPLRAAAFFTDRSASACRRVYLYEAAKEPLASRRWIFRRTSIWEASVSGGVEALSRDAVTNPSARIRRVPVESWNQMDVQVWHRLARGGPAVHSHVEAVRPKALFKNNLRVAHGLHERGDLLDGRVEEVGDVSLGNDQGMAGRYGIRVADRQRQVGLGDCPRARDQAEDAGVHGAVI